ncbi:MAG: hypothetical protein JJU15_09290 [Pararhodobacter sp.]|nr:hypothetical protein [Pararhodobacter sp.]
MTNYGGQMTVAASARQSEHGGNPSIASKRLVVFEIRKPRCSKAQASADR